MAVSCCSYGLRWSVILLRFGMPFGSRPIHCIVLVMWCLLFFLEPSASFVQKPGRTAKKEMIRLEAAFADGEYFLGIASDLLPQTSYSIWRSAFADPGIVFFRYPSRPFTTLKTYSTFARTDDFSCSLRLSCAFQPVGTLFICDGRRLIL